MAARNNTENKSFVDDVSNNRESQPYMIPINTSSSVTSQSSTLVRSADILTPRTETTTPARRIVVIRNTKNAQTDQGPIDLSELGKPNSLDVPPVISDGNKAVYLIRRPILTRESIKSTESYQPTPLTTLEHRRTPSPPSFVQQTVYSSDPPRSSSPSHSAPTRPKSPTSSTRSRSTQRYVPYMRGPKPTPRIKSPVQTNTIEQAPSASQKRTKLRKRQPSPPSTPPKQEDEQQEVEEELYELQRKPTFYSIVSERSLDEPNNESPPVSPVIIVNEQTIQENHATSTTKKNQRKKSTKPIEPVYANNQSTTITENSYITEEPLKSVEKRPKSSKQLRFADESDNKPTRSNGCWNCFGCCGTRNTTIGYHNNTDTYANNRTYEPQSIPHPHADLYNRRDYVKNVDNNPIHTSASTSNGIHRQPSVVRPVSTTSYKQQATIHRSNTSIKNQDNKSDKNNITIEMPERLVSGRVISPRTRERSLLNVVKNAGHIVDDAKKRYNGDVSNKIIVKVDPTVTKTT